MSAVRIELLPWAKVLELEEGTPLPDLLFAQGVEFPCGGRGRCQGCRVRVVGGELPITEEDRRLLAPDRLAAGWRLACRARARAGLRLELAQWETAVLADESHFPFSPRPGLGIAVDLGTTTVVAQLLDLHRGQVLAVRVGLNAQARHGADIMSRIDFASTAAGARTLCRLIREQVGALLADLLASGSGPAGTLREVVLVGNTVMHHLFCGLNVEPLSRHPFETAQGGPQEFTPAALGWELPSATAVHFLPCLGSFVGSDILAGILATGLHESQTLGMLIDLGTNGEIVVGNRDRLLCASTAAGPAFEGARISMGMRAAAGAIAEVTLRDGQVSYRVLGNTTPRGLCGSGLVDAATVGLELGWIQPSGRLANGGTLCLAPPVTLTQADVRELQLAKGAIAAGIRLLLSQWGAEADDVTVVHLAGAFGNYINRASARRIGLIRFPPERVRAAGNTALLGAKLALFGLPTHGTAFDDLRRRTRHVPLNDDERFHETFVAEMPFPA